MTGCGDPFPWPFLAGFISGRSKDVGVDENNFS